jgi:hypothetical protein
MAIVVGVISVRDRRVDWAGQSKRLGLTHDPAEEGRIAERQLERVVVVARGEVATGRAEVARPR